MPAIISCIKLSYCIISTVWEYTGITFSMLNSKEAALERRDVGIGSYSWCPHSDWKSVSIYERSHQWTCRRHPPSSLVPLPHQNCQLRDKAIVKIVVCTPQHRLCRSEGLTNSCLMFRVRDTQQPSAPIVVPHRISGEVDSKFNFRAFLCPLPPCPVHHSDGQ